LLIASRKPADEYPARRIRIGDRGEHLTHGGQGRRIGRPHGYTLLGPTAPRHHMSRKPAVKQGSSIDVTENVPTRARDPRARVHAGPRGSGPARNHVGSAVVIGSTRSSEERSRNRRCNSGERTRRRFGSLTRRLFRPAFSLVRARRSAVNVTPIMLMAQRTRLSSMSCASS
jgi:hypothetical protein